MAVSGAVVVVASQTSAGLKCAACTPSAQLSSTSTVCLMLLNKELLEHVLYGLRPYFLHFLCRH